MPLNSKQYLVLCVAVISFSSFYTGHSFSPPGTVRITDTFYADQTEVSNWSWHEFEWHTARTYGQHSPEHLQTLPDSTMWPSVPGLSWQPKRSYYRDPRYKNYPVVGISHEQAVAFAKWRTARVQEQFFAKYKKHIRLVYRLPTEQEWELVAGKTNTTSHTPVHKTRKKNDRKGRNTSENTGSTQPWLTVPVNSLSPNTLGLLGCNGNVAEMVAEKGIGKGGSWHGEQKDTLAGGRTSYSAPEAWLGFRCVCDLP